jgi:hypothetical protein
VVGESRGSVVRGSHPHVHMQAYFDGRSAVTCAFWGLPLGNVEGTEVLQKGRMDSSPHAAPIVFFHSQPVPPLCTLTSLYVT